MAIASKVSALLLVIRRKDVEALPPVERRRLADLCRHIANMADREETPEPKAGVLAQLRYGRETD